MKLRDKGIVALVGLGLLFLCAFFCFREVRQPYYQSMKVAAAVKEEMASEEASNDDAEEFIGEEEKKVMEVLETSNSLEPQEKQAYSVYGEGQENKVLEKSQAIISQYAYRNTARRLGLTEEDYNNLLRIVEAEATGGGEKSKKMVANVVLNRVQDNHFPDTVTKVVFQSCTDGTPQFSPTKDGRFYKVTVTDETKKVVDEVLNGKDESNGALFFLNRKTASGSSVAWFDSRLKYLFECGGHSYYCYRG